ncbi:MAG: alpha/beta fold hydrolase [Pseudomonadota bacterium]
MNILLLHGIFDTSRIFNRLIRALESAGHVCHAPSMKPFDARRGIHDLACSVEQFVDRNMPHQEPFLVVGFSMGGIVARQYMQVLGGASRVPAFFSISSPHAGSLASYLYFGQGVRDMRPRSVLLNRLRDTESSLDDMKIHNYWTSRDLVVIPAKNCRWARADTETDVRALLHRWMPGHRVVCQDIVRRVNELGSDMHARANEF